MPHYDPISDMDTCPDDYDIDVVADTRDDMTSSTDNEAETAQSQDGDSEDVDDNREPVINGTNKHDQPQATGHVERCITKEGGENIEVQDVRVKRRAESARDLVQSQERLILMLQSMKTDLSKMDREATSIKEEVVRSRQLFDVVVGRRGVHQLDYSANGYNLSHAMPKTSYRACKRRLDAARKSSFRRRGQLQLTDYYPSSSDNSRMSDYDDEDSRSFSDTARRSTHSRRRPSYRKEIAYFVSQFHGDAEQVSTSSQDERTQSNGSETESESNSEKNRKTWSRDSTGSRPSAPSRRSNGSRPAVSESSLTDSSTDDVEQRLEEQRQKQLQRRSSYYFVQKTESPPPEQLSDEVCL